MMWGHICGNGIIAPATTTKGQRRIKSKIIKITDRPLRRWRINQNPRSFDFVFKITNMLLIVWSSVQHRSMSMSTEQNQCIGFINRIMKILGAIHRQNRRKLLIGKGFILGDRFNFTNQNPSILW